MEIRNITLYIFGRIVLLIPVTKLNECPTSTSTRIPGDVEVIGLFDFHLPPSQEGVQIRQPLKDQITPSLMSAESAIWVFEGLNRNNYIPGVRLGMSVYGTGGSRQVSASIASMVYQRVNTGIDNALCNRPENASIIAGILGPGRSSNAEIVSNVLRGTNIPVMSYSSTSNSLRDLEGHPNLVFTIQSDRHQVQAMVKLIKTLGWDYVAIVYTDENYGISGVRDFKAAAEKEGICVATPRRGNYGIPLATSSEHFDGIISDLVQSRTKGVVYFGLQEYGKRLLEASARHQDAPSLLMWIFSEALGNNIAFDGKTLYALRGGLAVASAATVISSFQEYFVDFLFNVTRGQVENQRREWLENYVVTAFGCDFSNAPGSGNNQQARMCSSVPWSEINEVVSKGSTLYMESALKAAYAYAATIKKAHSILCDAPGVCDNLQTITSLQWLQYLTGLNITLTDDVFPFLPPELIGKTVQFAQQEITFNPESPIYVIKNYQKDKTVHVGTFDGKTLMLNTSDIVMYRYDSSNQPIEIKGQRLTRSTCPTRCLECVKKNEYKLAYKPGAHMILGVFPIHTSGCKAFRPTAGLQLLEAFLFAMERVSQRKGHLGNVSRDLDFGYVAFDDCYDEFKAVQILCDIYSGKRFGDITIDSNSIIGWVGPLSSGNCRPIANSLRYVHNLQISYGSTIDDFSDKNLFPYFMRTVPTDEQLVSGILSVCKEMGWTYVSIIHVNNDYGRSLRDSTLKYLPKYGICNTTVLEQNTHTDDHIAFSLLEASRNGAKVVLILADALNARLIIGIIKKYSISLNDDNLKDLLLIGTESWADRGSVVEGHESLSRGAITFKFSKDIEPEFDSYFKAKNPKNNEHNPWFNEFWEHTFNCNLEGNFNKTRPHTCTRNLNLLNHSSYHQDILVPFVTDAVYSLALGLDSLYASNCGPSFDQSCATEFTSLKRSKETFTNLLMEQVKRVNLPGAGAMYSDQGYGMTGYKILQWTDKGSDQWRYVEVGSFDLSSGLHLSKEKLLTGLGRSLQAECQGEACGACEFQVSLPATLTAPTVGSLALTALTVILIVTIAILSCKIIRMKKEYESRAYSEILYDQNHQQVKVERSLPPTPVEEENAKTNSDPPRYMNSGYANDPKDKEISDDDGDFVMEFENP